MRIIRFNQISNAMKLEPESFDDLYLLATIISAGDVVEAKSYRRFKASETDVGEQKEIFVGIALDKVEIDRSAGRLRLIGIIRHGRPSEFVSVGSYHTINVAAGDVINVIKPAWKDYIVKRLKQAEIDAKRPRLGIIVLDDEKALVSYIRGYGIDMTAEIYSHLSKRMKEKDYEKQRSAYFVEIIKTLENMSVDIVILAGPGFTKDDIKRYITDNNVAVKKRLYYAACSDAERSGIREVMRSATVSSLLESEHVRKEFEYLNTFMMKLRTLSARYGLAGVAVALSETRPERILVNDSVLNVAEYRDVLDLADRKGVKIEIFNSQDDAGTQLKNFGDIAVI